VGGAGHCTFAKGYWPTSHVPPTNGKYIPECDVGTYSTCSLAREEIYPSSESYPISSPLFYLRDKYKMIISKPWSGLSTGLSGVKFHVRMLPVAIRMMEGNRYQDH
jgi:hypothetical protein